MSEMQIPGPIDFVLLEFPGGESLDEVSGALFDLIDRGTVNLFDLVAIRKEEDGTFSGVVLDSAAEAEFGGFVAFAGARSGLLGDDDLKAAADVMEPGTRAVLIVFENTWARPFVGAALRANGQMIASTRIPAQEVVEMLDALEAQDAQG